jgi:O-antigen/teichoic acid export membrane protein
MSPGHHLVHGTALVLLADALLPLTGIVVASFLTRSLGAGNYGLLTLAVTLITWVEFAIVSLFARATVKIIGDADDWRPAGAAILRLHLLVSIAAMACCWVLAKPCAAVLGEPELASYVALYALDIPFFALAHCHRSILIGRGRYAERARASAARWTSRLILIILLVELGLSVNGAILGTIGASLVELLVARYYIRPSWSAPTVAPGSLWTYAVPIFLSTLILRLLGLGLFLLKMLGASAEQAGIYGAAQNVSFVMPAVLAASLSPLLLSTMTRVMREDDLPAARTLARNAIRTVAGMLPFAVIAAAASDDLAVMLFGAQFAGVGPLLAILVFAGLGVMMINLVNAILIACGKSDWTLWLAAPLLPAAVAGHLVAIPRFGPIGAASVSTLVAGLGAVAAVIAVCRHLKIEAPVATLFRSVLLSLMAYPLVYFLPAHGFAAVWKMALACALVLGGFFVLGEFRRSEIRFFRLVLGHALSREGI